MTIECNKFHPNNVEAVYSIASDIVYRACKWLIVNVCLWVCMCGWIQVLRIYIFSVHKIYPDVYTCAQNVWTAEIILYKIYKIMWHLSHQHLIILNISQNTSVKRKMILKFSRFYIFYHNVLLCLFTFGLVQFRSHMIGWWFLLQFQFCFPLIRLHTKAILHQNSMAIP